MKRFLLTTSLFVLSTHTLTMATGAETAPTQPYGPSMSRVPGTWPSATRPNSSRLTPDNSIRPSAEASTAGSGATRSTLPRPTTRW